MSACKNFLYIIQTSSKFLENESTILFNFYTKTIFNYSFIDTYSLEFPNLTSLTKQTSPTKYKLNSAPMCNRKKSPLTFHIENNYVVEISRSWFKRSIIPLLSIPNICKQHIWQCESIYIQFVSPIHLTRTIPEFGRYKKRVPHGAAYGNSRAKEILQACCAAITYHQSKS